MTPATCGCGCGTPVTGRSHGRQIRFTSGHNLRSMPMTARHRANIAAGQRRAWLTRRRMPLGSTRIAATGYVVVKVDESGRWRGQHVLLIEAELGRRLAPHEHVHHINGIKTDNRRDNLHLFSSNAEHASAHRSMERLLSQLLESGAITFDRSSGRYQQPVTYDRSLAPASRPGRDSVDLTVPAVERRRRGRIGTPELVPALL